MNGKEAMANIQMIGAEPCGNNSAALQNKLLRMRIIAEQALSEGDIDSTHRQRLKKIATVAMQSPNPKLMPQTDLYQRGCQIMQLAHKS